MLLDFHSDAVVYLGHAWCAPRCLLGLFALGPRAHRAPQNHLRAIGFDRYAARIDLCRSAQSFFDLAFDLYRWDVGSTATQEFVVPRSMPIAFTI